MLAYSTRPMPPWESEARKPLANPGIPGSGQFVGIIAGEMQAAALAALQRAENRHFSHFDEVTELEEPGLNLEIPVIFVDFPLQVADSGQGTVEALGGPDDAHIVPHGPLELIPVVAEDHPLVTVLEVPVDPFRKLGDGLPAGMEISLHRYGSTMGHDHSFQKAVAGQPVRSVKTCAGDLPAGVEPGDTRFPLEGSPDPAAMLRM